MLRSQSQRATHSDRYVGSGACFGVFKNPRGLDFRRILARVCNVAVRFTVFT